MSSSEEEEFNDGDDEDFQEGGGEEEEEEEAGDDGEVEEEEEEEAAGGEEEEEAEDSDDMPLASLKKDDSDRASPRKRKAISYADDDSDDDEDDVPLASLKKSPSKTKPKAAAAKKKAKAKPAVKAKAPTKTVTTSTKSGEYASPSAALYDSESSKGKLIQKLLCRWWYAMEWPIKSELPDVPPKHYDKLDGFEGVYVCTSGGKVGHILDLRPKETCPSFSNFAKKPAKEIKDLLLKALEEQLRQLVEAEGEGTPTGKEIQDDIKLVKRINADKADSEATKVLKAAKMKII